MTDQELRSRLVDDYVASPTEVIVVQDALEECAEVVMSAYQSANKWLDSIKEELLMTHSSVFFSNYIHELAHSMPKRFDKFGDILHDIDMKVPYPATPAIPYDVENSSISELLDITIQILDTIQSALMIFINSSGDSRKSAAINAEELLVDIDSERVHLYRMKRAIRVCGSGLEFDAWICQYINNLNSIID